MQHLPLCTLASGLLFTRTLAERMIAHLDVCAAAASQPPFGADGDASAEKKSGSDVGGDSGVDVNAPNSATTLSRVSLAAFFERHNPGKVAKVDALLHKYSGDRLEELLAKLYRKYGARPELRLPGAEEVQPAEFEVESGAAVRAEAASHVLGRCIAINIGAGCVSRLGAVESSLHVTMSHAAPRAAPC